VKALCELLIFIGLWFIGVDFIKRVILHDEIFTVTTLNYGTVIITTQTISNIMALGAMLLILTSAICVRIFTKRAS
jgi:hypothetical protein